MYLINGIKQQSIRLSDRSFQYGDGCFTTMLVKEGQVQFWPLHLSRLQSTTEKLSIDQPDWYQVEGWVKQLISDKPLMGIKILISRGTGGRGYSSEGCHDTQVVISAFDYPEHYLRWQSEGVELGVCKTLLGLNPLLAGLKHNNRLEQVLIKQEVSSLGVVDCVVLDIANNVIETSASNIFWVKDQILYTPLLNQAGVAGILRAKITHFASELDIKMKRVEAAIDELYHADEVFMTNALMGVVPVVKIANHSYQSSSVTALFQEKLSQC
jgi:4-amino-4-deoxychorismate lyase